MVIMKTTTTNWNRKVSKVGRCKQFSFIAKKTIIIQNRLKLLTPPAYKLAIARKKKRKKE